MTPIFIYDLLIGGINVSDFHIVVFFNDYYTLIVAFLAKQIQIQTCGNSTFIAAVRYGLLESVGAHNFSPFLAAVTQTMRIMTTIQAVYLPCILAVEYFR